MATKLGYSETVFVDDQATGELQIFTPAVELPFAGHPLVGTAWLLAQNGHTPAALRPPAGEVPARVEGDRAFVAGRPEWQPDYELIELGSPAEVEALDGPPPNERDLAVAYAPMGDDAAEGPGVPGRAGDPGGRGHRLRRHPPRRSAGTAVHDPPGRGVGDRRGRRARTATSRSAAWW